MNGATLVLLVKRGPTETKATSQNTNFERPHLLPPNFPNRRTNWKSNLSPRERDFCLARGLIRAASLISAERHSRIQFLMVSAADIPGFGVKTETMRSRT